MNMRETIGYSEGYRNGTADARIGCVNRYSYHGTANAGTYSADYFAGYRRAISDAHKRAYLRSLETEAK
jgi:hypothetical protein